MIYERRAHALERNIFFHVSVPADLVSLPELITEGSSGGIDGNEK